MSILDKGYISLKNHIHQGIDTFKSDEKGVSGIVATIILVLIAVVIALIFWKNIKEFVQTTLWGKVKSAANGLDNINEN